MMASCVLALFALAFAWWAAVAAFGAVFAVGGALCTVSSGLESREWRRSLGRMGAAEREAALAGLAQSDREFRAAYYRACLRSG